MGHTVAVTNNEVNFFGMLVVFGHVQQDQSRSGCIRLLVQENKNESQSHTQSRDAGHSLTNTHV